MSAITKYRVYGWRKTMKGLLPFWREARRLTPSCIPLRGSRQGQLLAGIPGFEASSLQYPPSSLRGLSSVCLPENSLCLYLLRTLFIGFSAYLGNHLMTLNYMLRPLFQIKLTFTGSRGKDLWVPPISPLQRDIGLCINYVF